MEDRDRKELNETGFGTGPEGMLCEWINLGFNR